MSRPHVDQWPAALRSAIELVEAAGLDETPWRFTGGSALASIYHHRYSRDADLFFSEPADLSAAEEIIREKFGHPTKLSGGYSLKVFLPTGSHVDLVNVVPLTKLPPQPLDFEGRTVARGRADEIATAGRSNPPPEAD